MAFLWVSGALPPVEGIEAVEFRRCSYCVRVILCRVSGAVHAAHEFELPREAGGIPIVHEGYAFPRRRCGVDVFLDAALYLPGHMRLWVFHPAL